MNLSNGDQGDNVKALQHALNAKGSALDEDGIFGDETEQAVRAFQQQQNLDVDGIAGHDTLLALGLDPDTLQPVSGGSSPTTTNVGGGSSTTPTSPTPVLVWPSSPLPPSESGRFDTALAKLEALVNASDDPRKWRYQCWINKLKTSGIDDRVVPWAVICPSTSGAIGAAFVVGPCELRGGRPTQEQIEDKIKSIPDVEAVGDSLGIFYYLKAGIVVDSEMTSLPLENLRAIHDDVQAAIDKLDQWANAPMGGSSAMPTAYVSIKDWIGQRQGDANSTYSCM